MSNEQPTVTRDNDFLVYRIRAGRGNYEWATIAIREWSNNLSGAERRERGEILIFSSFGSWAYQWGHLGLPFRRFLLTAEFDYVFTKFMGNDLEIYDGDATFKTLKARLIEKRRERHLDKKMIRKVWDFVHDHQSRAEESLRDFVDVVSGAIRPHARAGLLPLHRQQVRDVALVGT